MRLTIRAGLAVLAALSIAGCSSPPTAPSSPPASASAAPTSAAASSTGAASSSTAPATTSAAASPTPSPTSTPTPTPAPAGIDGRWCPTPQSQSTSCLSVKGKTVTVEGGGGGTIVRGPSTQDDGGVQYSFRDAPFGTYYRAGVPIDLPSYYPGKDLPKQERIWNSQTAVLYVRAEPGSASSAAAAPSVKGFPAELQGTWCPADGKDCFSVAEFRAENPQSFLSSKSASTEAPGATDYALCYVRNLGKDGCTTSASLFLRYLPAGTAWNCKTMGAKRFGLSTCKPDYSTAHDTSRNRLVIVPNHQQNTAYIDSEPLYRK